MSNFKRVSLEVKHRDAEYDAKEHLRNQYQLHHTNIDLFEPPTASAYGKVVYSMVKGIAHFILKNDGEEQLRYYTNTTGADWQQKDS